MCLFFLDIRNVDFYFIELIFVIVIMSFFVIFNGSCFVGKRKIVNVY